MKKKLSDAAAWMLENADGLARALSEMMAPSLYACGFYFAFDGGTRVHCDWTRDGNAPAPSPDDDPPTGAAPAGVVVPFPAPKRGEKADGVYVGDDVESALGAMLEHIKRGAQPPRVVAVH